MIDNTNFDKLIGKSITEYVVNDTHSAYFKLNDGSTLEIESNDSIHPSDAYYGVTNEFTVNIPDGFDFEDNVITRIVYENTPDECVVGRNITLGIFSNDKRIDIDTRFGSGSGWDYGQYVWITIVDPKISNTSK